MMESPSELLPELTVVPRHVAIIMDGNGRWARQRGLPRLAGHRAGTENVRRIAEACREHGVRILTLYAFSTENWKRPEEEVGGLMSLLSQVIERELDSLQQHGVRLRHLGALEDLPEKLQDKIRDAVDATAKNDKWYINIAINYGGRREILEAVRRMMREGVDPEDVTEEAFSGYLYTAGLPDPDLVIRTAGEMRLSNFLIWQSAYAEYFSTPTYWPDFGPEEFGEALAAYARRTRKFGGLPAATQ
jgi:undecaprenyl diphosphate synthase